MNRYVYGWVVQLYPHGNSALLVDETNPGCITTATFGFDYARWHNGIIATKLILIPTPVCRMWCNVSCSMLDRDPHAREARLTVQYELLVHDKLEIRRSFRLTCQHVKNDRYCSTCAAAGPSSSARWQRDGLLRTVLK